MLLDANSVHPYGSFWLDVADKAIKALAVIVGGAWTYINYVRARTFKRKLESNISGEIFSKNSKFFVLASCRLKNVGQSVYNIQQKGTAVQAIALRDEGRDIVRVCEVFKEHGWIEPGEQIEEPMVIPIVDPSTFVALKLCLRVVSEGVEWNASCILKG